MDRERELGQECLLMEMRLSEKEREIELLEFTAVRQSQSINRVRGHIAETERFLNKNQYLSNRLVTWPQYQFLTLLRVSQLRESIDLSLLSLVQLLSVRYPQYHISYPHTLDEALDVLAYATNTCIGDALAHDRVKNAVQSERLEAKVENARLEARLRALRNNRMPPLNLSLNQSEAELVSVERIALESARPATPSHIG